MLQKEDDIIVLIKCPECNKEISDKSEFCVHCGFSFSNIKMAKEEAFVMLKELRTCRWKNGYTPNYNAYFKYIEYCLNTKKDLFKIEDRDIAIKYLTVCEKK